MRHLRKLTHQIRSRMLSMWRQTKLVRSASIYSSISSIESLLSCIFASCLLDSPNPCAFRSVKSTRFQVNSLLLLLISWKHNKNNKKHKEHHFMTDWQTGTQSNSFYGWSPSRGIARQNKGKVGFKLVAKLIAFKLQECFVVVGI